MIGTPFHQWGGYLLLPSSESACASIVKYIHIHDSAVTSRLPHIWPQSEAIRIEDPGMTEQLHIGVKS